LRLTQIKLAGFKSFVDPTVIATPGQLVGIVGPNGCGKSNVIDAVRWVLGESKASALRGESMQDVIFNGAGDRKPVGRASVELFFDNSQGRIGGQWGQYSELSIKRVLTREGDSTYYINNIPVRRRDIHDLFLGTGLGPRAYAIIEQGMISRVIEAKPEELRIFLEEAAGVSKYKERRKETEGRLADTRENLSRVEDIRGELGAQIARLDAQARVATEYREFETNLRQSQHMLWYAKQQDAVRLREKHSTEIANLTAGFEALQADLRAAENRLETLRAEHFKAGDALHERQGAFYAANAEVTRLEQQLQFARESEGRLSQQVAQISEQIAAFTAQLGAIASDAQTGEREVEAALARREAAGEEERAATGALPALEAAVADASRALAEIQQHETEIEQSIQLAATRRRDGRACRPGQRPDRARHRPAGTGKRRPGRPRGEPRRTERRRAGAAGGASRGWRRMANHEQRAGRARGTRAGPASAAGQDRQRQGCFGLAGLARARSFPSSVAADRHRARLGGRA
jgi:chromosome segregation protein